MVYLYITDIIGSIFMNRKNKGRLLYNLLTISILPLCFLGIVLLALGSYFFRQTMYNEISHELKCVALNTEMLLDTAFPGDYKLTGETAYQLFKGDADITNDYSIIDKVKSDTGMDITLFYQDTRILTTISSSDGNLIVGTGAAEWIRSEVLYSGEAQFYHNANINGDAYFAYYMPLFNSDGSTAGMLFVGKPRAEVDDAVLESVYPLMIAVMITIIIMAICIFLYNKSIVSVLIKIRNFLSETADGDLNAELSPYVTGRNDELGQIGQSILSMQRSLRTMIETDVLTELFNRRSGHRRLNQIMKKAEFSGKPYSVSIGDIDLFKRVNDTYGHDCGDLVLKAVADTLRDHMRTCGFVARWGGEEFLLVFDHMNLEEAEASLNELLVKIRMLEIPYDGNIVKLTMTFGVTYGEDIDEKDLLCRADKLLYNGKQSGRNRVVSQPLSEE